MTLATSRTLHLWETDITIVVGQPIAHLRQAMYAGVNARATLASGTAGALRLRGGAEVDRALRALAPLSLGRAYAVQPAELATLGVEILLFGVTSRDTASAPRREHVVDALTDALRQAAERGIRSITLPEIGTQLEGTSLEAAAGVLGAVLADHLRRSRVTREVVVAGSHLTYLRSLRDHLLQAGGRDVAVAVPEVDEDGAIDD